MTIRRCTRIHILVVLDVVALIGLRGNVPEALDALRQPGTAMTDLGADAFMTRLAGAGLWLAAAWVAIGLLLVNAADLPGVAGVLAARAGRLVVPRVLQRVLAGSAGLGVLLAPVVAEAHPALGPAGGGQASVRPASNARVSAVPAPGWPVGPRPASLATAARPPTGDSPARVVRSADPAAPVWPHDTTGATTHPARRAAAPSSAPRDGRRHGSAAPASSDPSVRVHTGDSLWLLAARRLGPGAAERRIDAYWPRLYAANRNVVGDDPAVITPGQLLREPTADPQEAP